MTTPSPQLRIGRYALLGRVGRGGMGEVHRARAFGAAGVTKELCIKRIRRSRLADPGALARFVDEARLWMRLSHANIVPVFDFGRIENDYYLAMEWVDGCDLRRLCDDAEARADPLEDDVALFVAAEITRALSYLHDAGAHEGRAVAHCDLKPSNVLLSRSSEVKLADFGVAVAADSARAGGTRGYIPPSETHGARVEASADLYALGRVLEELLSSGPEASPSAEREEARRLAVRLLEADGSLSAAKVADQLEALSARARVRSNRSPRELLALRVARVPVVIEPVAATDLHTDASFVNEGADAQSFFSHMEGDLSRTTSSRDTPAPAAEPRRQQRTLAIGLGTLMLTVLVAMGVRDWASEPSVPSVPERPRPTPAAEAAPAAVEAALATEAPASDRLGVEAATEPATEPPAEPAEARAEAPAALVEPRPRREAVPLRPRSSEPGETELEATTAPEVSPAHLRINARPWAEVTIDGAPHGLTPITDLELAPGTHEVRLLHPVTGRESTTIVDLDPGEHFDVIVDLRR